MLQSMGSQRVSHDLETEQQQQITSQKSQVSMILTRFMVPFVVLKFLVNSHGILQARVLEWGAIAFSGSVTQSCPTLCDPMDCSTPDFLVHHQLMEFAQTHVHRVGDAIQPSHPLLSHSSPALIFPSIRVFSNESVLPIKVLEFQLQHQSF